MKWGGKETNAEGSHPHKGGLARKQKNAYRRFTITSGPHISKIN